MPLIHLLDHSLNFFHSFAWGLLMSLALTATIRLCLQLCRYFPWHISGYIANANNSSSTGGPSPGLCLWFFIRVIDWRAKCLSLFRTRSFDFFQLTLE